MTKKKWITGNHMKGSDVESSIKSLEKVAENYPEKSRIRQAYMNNANELRKATLLE